MADKKITKKDLDKVFWRMQLMNVTNNFESMQAIGFLASFAPVLDRLYKDEPEELRIQAMHRHLAFYNSHVNSNALILGVAAAIEETTNEEEKDAVTNIKTGLMGPLAGIGDSLLKFTWLPIAGSIGASLALNGNILGPILMFIIYNSVNLFTKYYGIHWGYEKGVELIEDAGSNIFQRISNIASVIGLMVVGALIASVIDVNLVAQFNVSDNVIEVQEMLDKVMPNLLSLLASVGVYFTLKKTDGKYTTTIIFSIMILSILLVWAGVLG